MLFHAFIHADSGDINDSIFRSNVIQFVNDNTTHPIVKYQGFIVAFVLIVSGLLILLLFNGERIFGHSYWKNLFIPISPKSNQTLYMSDAAIFREAVEGMTSSEESSESSDGKAKNESGQYTSSDKDGKEKSKKTPCGTDCGQYIELQSKIKDLSKYVNAVKEQKESIKQTDEKLNQLGKKVEDLNKSLSPGGQLNIEI